MSDLLTGVCRSVFPWTDNSAILNIGFGTHLRLQVWQGGGLYDVTPFGPPRLLGTDPLATTNTTARVDVHDIAHGFTTGLNLKVFGAATVATVVPNGTWIITVDDVDHYHFTAGSNANATVPAGGGSGIVVTPQTVLPAGAIDGTGTVGYSTGAYGIGPWGETSPTTTDYFPRTWAHGAWGQNWLASPRNGGLYQWSNDTSQRAVAVNNAPVQITFMLVAPLNGGYQAFALGCNQEADGVFNPMCIRHCSIRTLDQWSTLADGSTAREYVLTGGGHIVAGRMAGPYMLVWTNDALFLGTFTGALNQPWRFDRVGRNCGLIGPNAAVVVGQTAFWASPDRQFYSYDLGGQPSPLDCPIRTEYAEHLAASQGDKVIASSNAAYSEVRWDYPDDREGFENSRFVRMCLASENPGAWSQGILARTAFTDAGPTAYPVGVTFGGAAYYHEKGHSADGTMFAWSILSAGQLIDIDSRMLLKGCWPDFQDQLGPITVTAYAMEHPQGVKSTAVSNPMSPADEKADLLLTGRIFQVGFSGDSAPTSMRLGRPAFEIEQAGRY